MSIASFVVFLWSSVYLADGFSERNRYYMHWERQDACWRMLPIAVYALLAVILSIAVDWSGKAWARRVFNGLFLLALGGGMLSIAVHYLSKLRPYPIPLLEVATHFGWLVLAAIVGYAMTRDHPRFLAPARHLCLICSPSVLLVFVQLLRGPVYPARMDPFPASSDRGPGPTGKPISIKQGTSSDDRPPVYWFIFDEWSYERSYQDGRPRAFFRNLDEFSRGAMVFHDAHSPGSRTEISVPEMLYESRSTPVFENGRLGFRDETGLVPVDRLQSILASPARRGYFRVLVGFGLPYSKWVGRDLDLCREYRFIGGIRSLPLSLRSHAAETAQFSADPLMNYLYERWTRTAPFIGYYRQLHVDLRRDVRWALTQSPRQTFALLHYNLPHKPYLFDADGNELPTTPGMTTDTVDKYERHLACLDHRIGEFLGLLRENGRLDGSLVILTSDHGWRADPLRRTGENPVTHVPLIVKLPYQQRGYQINERFENRHLGSLITEALGEPTSADYQSILPRQWQGRQSARSHCGPSTKPAQFAHVR